MKFRKKPVVIDAIQWTGNNRDEVANFVGQTGYNVGSAYFYISTLEGVMSASPYDWIVKGVNGEFYPVKPDIFEKTYEATS